MACQSNQLGGIVSGPRETLDAGKVNQLFEATKVLNELELI
jgi:hypothetical protein